MEIKPFGTKFRIARPEIGPSGDFTSSSDAWYDADTYRSWQAPGQSSEVTTHAANPDELRKEGIYRVVTPDECVALAEELGPTGTIVLHPLMGGMPAELGWSSLRLFRERVLPSLRP